MSEEFGPDFITVTDENGEDHELELLDSIIEHDKTYLALLPADMNEDDPDFGIIILRVEEENGEEVLVDVDNEDELNRIYEIFMTRMEESDDAEEE
ncbi:MAG: hypothetical protein H6Q60_1264 [Oscillospiraceae bacterium]|nr:hypothetical protein [Oscillospiraceae bacterium]